MRKEYHVNVQGGWQKCNCCRRIGYLPRDHWITKKFKSHVSQIDDRMFTSRNSIPFDTDRINEVAQHSANSRVASFSISCVTGPIVVLWQREKDENLHLDKQMKWLQYKVCGHGKMATCAKASSFAGDNKQPAFVGLSMISTSFLQKSRR